MAKKESSGFNTPFEGLKRMAEKPPAPARPAPAHPAPAHPAPAHPAPARPAPPKPAPPPASAAAKATKAAESDDERSFAEAMRGTVPLTGAAARGRRTSPLGAPPPQPAPRPRAPARNDDADAEAELAELVSGTGSAVRDSDRRLSRRLRNGDYPIEAQLDLHGHTREEAASGLERLVVQSVAAGRRCVLVIHGRGLNSGDSGPVLREAVDRVLSTGAVARAIITFTYAGPAHGGDGATLVLLRKKKST